MPEGEEGIQLEAARDAPSCCSWQFGSAPAKQDVQPSKFQLRHGERPTTPHECDSVTVHQYRDPMDNRTHPSAFVPNMAEMSKGVHSII